MAIKIPVSIDVISANPIDTRLVLSKDEMFDTIDAKMPDVYFAICSDDGNLYIYNKQNDLDPDTGKYRLVKSDAGEIVLDEKSISKNAKGELEILGYSSESANGKWLHKRADGVLEWVDFSVSKPIERLYSGPIDASYSWNTLQEALDYTNTSPIAYVGQIIYVNEYESHYKITNDGLVKLTTDQIVKLYNELGDHTDGAITQKAISEMINEINEKITELNGKVCSLDTQVVVMNEKMKNKIEAVVDSDSEILQLIRWG